MSAFIYTATRDLATGTVLDSLVSRDFRLTSFPRANRAVVKQNTSLSGAVESLKNRTEKSYTCQTELITPQSLTEERILEFIASTDNGENFLFDRYGTVASPDNQITCIMVSSAVGQAEQGKVFHRYRFVIREN